MGLSIPLTNELALKLTALRQPGETLEETGVRLILAAYTEHKEERESTTDATSEG